MEFVVSAASYAEDGLCEYLKVHTVKEHLLGGMEISEGYIIQRDLLVNLIISGVKFSTVKIANNGDWMIEKPIIVEGLFLKTLSDVEYRNDLLGDLPHFDITVEEH